MQPYNGIVDSLKNEEIDLHMVCSSPMKIEMEYFTQKYGFVRSKKVDPVQPKLRRKGKLIFYELITCVLVISKFKNN